MTAKNARIVANAIVLAGGGVLAFLALRQPFLRRTAFRVAPMLAGGAPPLQIAAFAIAHAIRDHTHEPPAARDADTASRAR
jgi:hypothetical protein